MILIIQVRGDQAGPHEIKCIHDATGLPYSEFAIVNTDSKHVTGEDILAFAQRADAVFIGGSGEVGYESDTKELKERFARARVKLTNTIKYLIASDVPTLGMCLGHQIIADVAGGTLVQDPDQAEAGVAEITLTEEGKKDPLFEGMEESFNAVVGHKTSIEKLPKEAVHLASSEKSKNQAYRIGEHVYGTQFHPELNHEGIKKRLGLYPEYKQYLLDYDDSLPISAHLVTRKFVENIM